MQNVKWNENKLNCKEYSHWWRRRVPKPIEKRNSTRSVTVNDSTEGTQMKWVK